METYLFLNVFDLCSFRDRMGENFAFTGGVLNVKGGRGPGFLIIEDPATSNLGFLAFSLVATEDDDFEALISNVRTIAAWF